MEVRRVEEINVYTTDGTLVCEGQTIVWSNNKGENFCGIYRGLDQRNNIMVETVFGDDAVFHIMPKAISELYLANIAVLNAED